MKTFRHFSIPALAFLALLGCSAAGLADDRRRITVYQDNDGDGHYHKKRIEVPNHRYPAGIYNVPSAYYRWPYPYYSPGPALGVTITRSYSQPRSYSHHCSDDLAMEVQRELRRRGYYRGSIDGDVGPGTRSAIYEYQADRGLPRTGRIDRSLLRSLGIG